MEQISAEIAITLLKAPHMMLITQYYSKCYYDSRIKTAFEAECVALNVNTRMEKPRRMEIFHGIASWLRESETTIFKDWLQKIQIEDFHREETEAYQNYLGELQQIAPDSPDSFHVYAHI